MNNNFFSLTRYLRDRGVDARLLLFNDEFPHFHPSTDTFDLNYQEYTTTLDWGKILDYRKTDRNKIRRDMDKYDFIIGCHTAPAYLNKAGMELDIFTPFGSDLYEFPFFKFSLDPVILGTSILLCGFSRSQKRGIKNAKFINTDSILLNEPLEKIKPRGIVKQFRIPMVYTPVFNPESIAQYYTYSQWYHEFKKIRDTYELVIFHQSRHYWKSYADKLAYKGNDILIRGFSQFIKAEKNINSCLILFEYGPDVNASKELIEKLGINKNIRWFPLMHRKELMIGMSMSDIGAGQFSRGWLTCGSILEILAMGKPMIGYRDDQLYNSGEFKELYPMINVRTAEDICNSLRDYILRKDFYSEIGRQGNEWFMQYLIEEPLNKYLAIINKKTGTVISDH